MTSTTAGLVCTTKISIPLLSPTERSGVNRFITLRLHPPAWNNKEIPLRSLGGKTQEPPRVIVSLIHTRNFHKMHLCYWCPPLSTPFHRGNRDTRKPTADKYSFCWEELTVKASFSFTSAWPFPTHNHSTDHICDRILLIRKTFLPTE